KRERIHVALLGMGQAEPSNRRAQLGPIPREGDEELGTLTDRCGGHRGEVLRSHPGLEKADRRVACSRDLGGRREREIEEQEEVASTGRGKLRRRNVRLLCEIDHVDGSDRLSNYVVL